MDGWLALHGYSAEGLEPSTGQCVFPSLMIKWKWDERICGGSGGGEGAELWIGICSIKG